LNLWSGRIGDGSAAAESCCCHDTGPSQRQNEAVQAVAPAQQSAAELHSPPGPSQAHWPFTQSPPKQSEGTVVAEHRLPVWDEQRAPKTPIEQHPELKTSVKATDPAGRQWQTPARQAPSAQSSSLAQDAPSAPRKHVPA
jgi:hypothetical protein